MTTELRALIAEDDAVSRRLLKEHLENWGISVTEAADGAAAWEMFEAQPTPLVIADWMMPEMDGIELIRRIRGLGITPYVYIILLTARSQKEDLVHGMESGADDFVTKPFDREELRVRINAGKRVLALEKTLEQKNLAIREAEAALVQSEKFASVGMLAVGVAHEVHEPLANVGTTLDCVRTQTLGLASILETYSEARPLIVEHNPELAQRIADLERDVPGDRSRAELAMAMSQCLDNLTRVREVIRNLRDFSRLNEFIVKEMSINDAVEDAVSLVARDVFAKQAVIRVDAGDVPRIHGNPGKLKKVLLNLLSNAIDAVPMGGAINIRTHARQAAKGVLVEVEDNGRGIPPEHLPHIFEPFYTIGHSNSLSSPSAGTRKGLGLATAYSIVNEHGGCIKVDSVVGQGSVFRVRLPLRPPGV